MLDVDIDKKYQRLLIILIALKHKACFLEVIAQFPENTNDKIILKYP